MYDIINSLSPDSQNKIKTLISGLNTGPYLVLDKVGFQVILDVIKDFTIDNKNLHFLIERRYKDKDGIECSVLTASLLSYIYNGYSGVYDYNYERLVNKITEKAKEAEKQNKTIDIEKETENAVNSAMRTTSTLIFNTFKYQLVKYLGVFNLMYKFRVSQHQNKEFEDIIGIDKLLIKLEYNAFSPEARIASDYGVPQRIVEFYDSKTVSAKNSILQSFDNYEKQIYQRIKKIIEE